MPDEKQPIEIVHPAYDKNMASWAMVKHLCEGKDVQGFLLPKYDDANLTPDITAGYRTGFGTSSDLASGVNKGFFERAVFYNIVGSTLNAFVGTAFARQPEIDLPALLEPTIENTDGDGTNILQFAQDCLVEVLQTGRAGILTDYPSTEDDPAKQSEAARDRIFPTLQLFCGTTIRDWRTIRIGAVTVTSYLILSRMRREGEEMCETRQELMLNDAGVVSQMWKKEGEGKEAKWVPDGPAMTMRGSRGEPLTELPWTWIGSRSNTHHVDPAPLYPLAILNRAHYRSSAIYEDSVYQCGQIQPVRKGFDALTADQEKREGVAIGSGVVMDVPADGDFFFAQAEPNMIAKESMDSKLDAMMALGARLLQPGGVAKTAYERESEDSQRHSTLSWAANNVSEAMVTALRHAGMFAGADNEPIFEINTEFVLKAPDPQVLQQILTAAGFPALTKRGIHKFLASHGLETPDYDEWESELEEPEPVMMPMPGDNPFEDDDDDDDDDPDDDDS